MKAGTCESLRRAGRWAVVGSVLAAEMGMGTSLAMAQHKEIVHDAECDVLEAQHGEKWAAEGKQLDAKLAAFREKNNGRPPNILYILIDDIAPLPNRRVGDPTSPDDSGVQ